MFRVVVILIVLMNYSEANIKVSGSTMLVRQTARLVCKSQVNISKYPGRMLAYHQWNQVYKTKPDRVITNLGAIQVLNTQLTIELEKFDNNTSIYSSFSVHNASNGNKEVFNLTTHCSGMEEAWINLVDDGFYKYHIDKILKFDTKKQTTFSCQEYSAYAEVGWINTYSNKIFVSNTIKIILTLTAAHNGSMLCCVYYTVNFDANGLESIRRHVKGRTLLIHVEEVSSIVEPREPSTSSITTEKDEDCKPTNEPGMNSNVTNEPGQNSKATNVTDSNKNTDITDSSDQDSDTNSNLTIIIPLVSASMLFLLVAIYAIRKRCWRGTSRPPRPQLPLPQEPSQRSTDELDPNSPFYLNLLFRKECELEIQAREEPQYEEVMYH